MSDSPGPPSDGDAQVIILGGGLAGLRCAAQLVVNHGLSQDRVVLLEASPRIGGRIKTNTSFIEGFSVSNPAQHAVGHVLLREKLCILLSTAEGVHAVSCFIDRIASRPAPEAPTAYN